MINTKSHLSWLKFFLVCLILVAFFVFALHFSSAFTLDQQNAVCEDLNFSFVQCFGLWSSVDQFFVNGSFVIPNNTIYINQTQNVTVYVNSTNSTIFEKNCSADLELIKQADATKIRLAEIEKGLGSSQVAPVNFISQSECDLKVSDAVVKSKETSAVQNAAAKTDYTKYWWIVLLVAVAGFFYYKKNGSFVSSPQRQPVLFTPTTDKPQEGVEQ